MVGCLKIFTLMMKIYFEIGNLDRRRLLSFHACDFFLLGCVSFCHIMLEWLWWSFYASCCATEFKIYHYYVCSFSFSLRVMKHRQRATTLATQLFPFCITTDIVSWWRLVESSMKATCYYLYFYDIIRIFDVKRLYNETMYTLSF